MNTLPLTEKATREIISHQSLKVKMFIQNNAEEAEKTIGHWLKQNDVTIHHITQSQSEKNGSFVFVISVFYQQNS